MATTTSRAARVMTEADKRLQDAGFDGSQSRAVILSAAEIVDEAIRPLATKEDLAQTNRRLAIVEEKVAALGKEVVALGKEVVALGKEVAALGKEIAALGKEAAAARTEAAAAHEATKELTGELDRFRDRTTAEMAMGFARMSRQLWMMAVGAVGATAIITFGIVNLLR